MRRQILLKIKQNFHDDPSGGSQSFQGGQTDMGRSVIAAFRQSFANAPKIVNAGQN
jgi:hypothetical protein